MADLITIHHDNFSNKKINFEGDIIPFDKLGNAKVTSEQWEAFKLLKGYREATPDDLKPPASTLVPTPAVLAQVKKERDTAVKNMNDAIAARKKVEAERDLLMTQLELANKKLAAYESGVGAGVQTGGAQTATSGASTVTVSGTPSSGSPNAEQAGS